MRRFSALLVLLLAACAQPAPEAGIGAARASASIEAAPYPNRVYWGDTHVHTSTSADALATGTRLGPEVALRFARGERVRSVANEEVRLDRPLDFMVIADHAEYLGAGAEILAGNPLLLTDPTLRRWHEMMRGTREQAYAASRELIAAYHEGRLPAAMSDPAIGGRVSRSVWETQVATVERYNEPGRFTAFLGYEFTSVPQGNNLHRVVIYRDGPERVLQVSPFTAADSPDPEDLWQYLANYERDTGGRALAIPHNGNVSNGMMFALETLEGGPLSADYAQRRARWEPLTEVTQIKGDSESHPFLSPNDEFAGFGDQGWDIGNLTVLAATTDQMRGGNYARAALLRGLRLEQQLGINPFKFGMIGASDAHNATPTYEESAYLGSDTLSAPSARRIARVTHDTAIGRRYGWHQLTGGLAAVWARGNTREALFDAMQRREVYATTGPRMLVRFFGGWDFRAADLRGDAAESGYGRGVPMGGDLAPRRGRRGPTFLVSALRDPSGANLDRVQIVKGWLGGDGELHERVFDVVWSEPGRRRIGADGKLSPVGDTIDLAHATYENTIGAPQLSTVWRDPDFDPAQRAFYYARVLEIPTPRWVVYDAVRLGAAIPDGAQVRTQERAYTSPIWYAPGS
jgi:Protein of unknown function (DUF3604)